MDEVFDDRKVYIDSLSIQAYSSPDGNRTYNQRLAEQRAGAVQRYLIFKYPYLSRYDIRIFAGVEKWEEVLAIVENLPDVPYREQVRRVLSSHDRSEVKESKLKAIGGGAAYRYILKNILPELRNALALTAWVQRTDADIELLSLIHI